MTAAGAHQRLRIGLLGGSFDPIHVGHLALARSAATALALDRMIVIPTGSSWQKVEPGAGATDGGQTPAPHRLAMVQIALQPLADQHADSCDWTVDDLEVKRPGPSYTIDTLQTLRQRFGPEAALILILGSDQLRNLATWHRWQDLLDFAHIAATQREQIGLTDLPAPIEQLLQLRGRQTLPDTPAGSIVLFQMPPVAVSGTGLRAQLPRSEIPQELLPPGVAEYIVQHHLYQKPTTLQPHRTRVTDNR